MSTELMVREAPPEWRLPRKDVWETVVRLDRRDAATGKVRKAKAVIVRWRTQDGKVAERRFWDALEAEKFSQNQRAAVRRGALRGRPLGTTFGEWADAYLSARFPDYVRWKNHELKRLSGEHYVGLLHAAIEAFKKHVGDVPLSDYRNTDFERFRTNLLTSGGLRPTTVESYLQRIRTVFRAAETEGLLTQRFKIEVRQIAYEKPVLEKAEIDAIFEKAATWPPEAHMGKGTGPGRLRPILMTLYYTMVRRGELVHLAWDDVKWEDGRVVEILIQPKNWSEDGAQRRWEPKDREIRAIPVHPRLAEILADLSKERRHKTWVFTDGGNHRWSEAALASLMRRFEKASGYKLGFHIWRRTGLTHLHDASAPIKDVQAIAGHANIATTMKYVRSSSKGQRQTILKLT